jgi:hypothetical protein
MSKKYNIEFINVWTREWLPPVPGPGARLQAFKQPDAGIEATSQGLKPGSRVHKLQDPGTRVQAYKLVQGTSYQDKSIFFVFNVERYLVRGEPHNIGFFRGGYF